MIIYSIFVVSFLLDPAANQWGFYLYEAGEYQARQ
jgi:hypothetical protein